MTWTRRQFVGATAAAGAATALAPRGALGANERVGVALVGCGGRGRQLWPHFLGQADVNPVAVCDVYDPFARRAAEAAGGRPAIERDFRRILDRRDVDALIVASPDHWHALHTVMACRAGKDVYVEKPLSLTVREGRLMTEAARSHSRVVQTGSQQRSGAHYARAVTLVQGGAIGAVHKITAGHTRNVMPGFTPRELKEGLTPELDWDMWLGPAPLVPFDPFRCIYHFRWFWSHSGGQMTNWGAHDLDIARWALGARAPTSVAGFGGRFALRDGGETPDVQEVLYDFPEASLGGGKGCVVSWTVREIGAARAEPLVFHGTKGSLAISRRGFKVVPDVWKADSQNETPATSAVEEPGAELKVLDAAHVRNFLDCVKSRNRPVADVEDGHLTAAMCHLGNIATRLGRGLRWDAEREDCVGDAEASGRLHYEYRRPWTL
ncbi:MAG TPA: Gfo/Idh/MocA family oxidoreductase [Vicinamibacteria bacterium]|nr:Gfo/Idh/MocA family oxidoreductase [Vicinamibacteria bacterium]